VQSQRYLTYLIFSVISLLGGFVPVLIATLMGERAQDRLDGAQAWLMAHGDALTLAVLAIFGVDFVSKGLGGLIG
jgi:hypothetical protein